MSIGINASVIIDKYTSSRRKRFLHFQTFGKPYKANVELADSIPRYTYVATDARKVAYHGNPLYHHEWNTTITSIQNFLGTGYIK